jgi:hypothetical protein
MSILHELLDTSTIQLLTPSLNPKQQTDLVNNFPEQMSSLAILPFLRLKRGGGILITLHQKNFYCSIEGTVNKIDFN